MHKFHKIKPYMDSINQGLVSHPFFLKPFCFNTPYQFTPLPNFDLLICDMTLIFHLWNSFLWEYVYCVRNTTRA